VVKERKEQMVIRRTSVRHKEGWENLGQPAMGLMMDTPTCMLPAG
jgi:hypothetical protein